MDKVPRWGFSYVSDKTFDFSSKNYDFLPKKVQIWPENGIFVHFGPGLAGSFGALLVGWLVVVAHGLSQDTYLLYHLSNSSHMKCSLNFRYRLLGVWLPVYKISFSFLIAFLCYL